MKTLKRLSILSAVVFMVTIVLCPLAQAQGAEMPLSDSVSSKSPAPKHNSNSPGWIEFATVSGIYVGDRDRIRVYYNADTLDIQSSFVRAAVRSSDNSIQTEFILQKFSLGGWGSWGGEHPVRIVKGSLAHRLLKALKRRYPHLNFND